MSRSRRTAESGPVANPRARTDRAPPRHGWWSSRLAPVSLALVAVVLVNLMHAGAEIGVAGTSMLGSWEHAILQWRQGRSAPVSREIALVVVENETPSKLRELARDRAGPVRSFGLPLPRRYHAELLSGLRRAGARVVVLDLLFLEPSSSEDDEALREEIRGAAPMRVTLAADYDPARSHLDPAEPSSWVYWFRRPVVLPEPPPPHVQVASAVAFDPGEILRGVILLRPDAASGDRPIPHLALSAFLGYEGLQISDVRHHWESERLTAGRYSWPTGKDGELLVRWPRADQPGPSFQSMEYSEAYNLLNVEEPSQSTFRGRVVIIGDGTGVDAHNTAIGRLQGVEFVAHALNTLLAGGGVVRWSLPANALWALALSLAAGVCISRMRPLWILGGVLVPLALAAVVPQAVLAAGQGIDTAGPALSVGLAGLLSGLYYAVSAGRFRPGYVRDHSALETATVMFVDLSGSTLLAERLGPMVAGKMQSELLHRLSAVVIKSGGVVERTLGDGLMAVYRSRRGEHARRAVAAVEPLVETADAMARDWEKRLGVMVGVTVGMETGTVAGTLVDASYTEWSSFGPTVNQAARIQSACGGLGVPVLLGPATRGAVAGDVPTRFVAQLALKGIAEPVPVYTLTGYGRPPEQGERHGDDHARRSSVGMPGPSDDRPGGGRAGEAAAEAAG